MLTNDQMKAGRFEKLARGRRIMARMNACWDAGGFVRIGTMTKYFDVKPKSRNIVKMGKSGSVYMNRDCIDYCSIQFSE